MNKKSIFLICVIAIVIVIIITFFVISKKRTENRNYDLLQVSEYKYYTLKVEDNYGVIKRDGNVLIEPQYDEVQIPNQDRDVFIVKEDDKYIVFNEKNEQIFKETPDVSAIEGKDDAEEVIYNNTVLKYMENGLYGLISLDGEKITKPLYEEITSLKDKYGEILVKKDGKYGVVNVKGKRLVATKYDSIVGDGFSENGSYKNGGYIVGNRSNKGIQYGYLDKNEKEIVKIEQESLYRVTELNSQDIYLVGSQNGRYALFKNKENLTDYKYIDIFYNNGTQCFTVTKNKSYGLINMEGKVLIPEEYEELMVVGIYVKAHKNNSDYIFDLNGNQVKDSKFTSLQQTKTGKFYITINDDYKYGIADKNQEVVVENKYDYIDEIETTGLLIATIDDDVTIYSGNASEIVSVEDAKVELTGDYIKVITSDEAYYLTVQGRKVDNKTVYLENKIYASKDNGKWGFVDLRDSIIVPYQYDEVTELNEYGFAGIKKNGKWGVINSDGKIVLEPIYESDEVNPIFIGKYVLQDNIVTDELF